MTPLDLKPKEEWEAILDRFAQNARMTTCLTDEASAVLFCRMDRYPLCAAIRSNSEALTFICSQTNTAMLAVVKKTLEPEIDACEIGLLRVVVPLVRDGALVGLITACGLAPEDGETETFLASKQLDMPEERVHELLQSTPVGSEKDLKALAERLFHELNPK